MKRPAFFGAALLVVCALAAQAQDAPPAALRFDVVSVKPNTAGGCPPCYLTLAPDGGRVVNLPLSTILWMSHRVQADQMIDIPSWARSESFDIIGKAPAGVPITIDNIMAMMRDTLAERFQLKTRLEMRERPVYALVQIKPGALGPKLAPAKGDCPSMNGPRGRGMPPPAAAPPTPAMLRCGGTTRPGAVSVHGMPLDAFTRLVGPIVGRMVINRTGLEGDWDLDLEFTPEGLNPVAGAPPGAPASAPSDLPSVFTAVQEQLGLKLESTRAPVEVLVIERLERPTPD
jgi:uncharacterized protein (TIGR03435 family)